MKLNKLTDLEIYQNIFKEDLNKREINVFKLTNIIPCTTTYPNFIFYQIDSNDIIKPSDDRIMSLDIEEDFKFEKNTATTFYNNPLFYFVYNVDNYYHFIYDTLPYLISFFELKKQITDLKLLMNYANDDNKFYRFVTEFLEILDISNNDIIIIDKNTLYSEVYVSNSYTHGIDSNLPPRQEIYDLYQSIVDKVINTNKNDNLPKKIYISRRTWLNNDLSNIGTNYTTRRRLECEDELVEHLIDSGYEEVFTENLTTVDKILLFNNVESVIGAIGGGLCNVLFSKKNTKLITIVSPTFLDVNYRFKYSLDQVNNNYFMECENTETGIWKKYIRVKYKEMVGEIIDIYEDDLLIAYSDESVAGWNSNMVLKNKKVDKSMCKRLDNGLNSSWTFDIDDFINFKKTIIM
jgi:hypothetical protein